MLLPIKDFNIIWLSDLVIMSIPDKGTSREMFCTLNLIAAFLLDFKGAW
jgi:hypothetical protein